MKRFILGARTIPGSYNNGALTMTTQKRHITVEWMKRIFRSHWKLTMFVCVCVIAVTEAAELHRPSSMTNYD